VATAPAEQCHAGTRSDSTNRGGTDSAAETRFDRLFAGIVVPRPAWIPIGGVPSHIGDEDTFDGDYGRLLAAVYRKGVTSPRPLNTLRRPLFRVVLDFDGAVKLAA
jgi:hypothetical protein